MFCLCVIQFIWLIGFMKKRAVEVIEKVEWSGSHEEPFPFRGSSDSRVCVFFGRLGKSLKGFEWHMISDHSLWKVHAAQGIGPKSQRCFRSLVALCVKLFWDG